MVYDQWVIGGVTPTWIVDVDPAPNKTNPQFTVHCFADSQLNLNGLDPRTEIALFEAMLSQAATNTPLLNGGTKLQIQNGDYITVTDGVTTWSKAALVDVKYNPDLMSQVRMFYDLVLMVETEGSGGSYVYTPNYGDYNNIEYYFWTDKTSRITGDNADGTELGWMQITEPQNVTRVELYGSACAGSSTYPPWIEVNGERQYWHYSHDVNWPDNTLPSGWEKLVFPLATPTDVVTIETSNHVMPNNTLAENLGAWLQWVRLIYE